MKCTQRTRSQLPTLIDAACPDPNLTPVPNKVRSVRAGSSCLFGTVKTSMVNCTPSPLQSRRCLATSHSHHVPHHVPFHILMPVAPPQILGNPPDFGASLLSKAMRPRDPRMTLHTWRGPTRSRGVEEASLSATLRRAKNATFSKSQGVACGCTEVRGPRARREWQYLREVASHENMLCMVGPSMHFCMTSC